jgi:lipoyl(octanoyl) transferase
MLNISSNSKNEIYFLDWGLISYEVALEKQMELAHQVAEEGSSGYIVFCTHPPVVTLGRATQEGDVTTWTGEIKEVSRGGRATYHGPSQVVVYPIINLKKPRQNRKAQEITGFLRDFENAIVETLKTYQIQSIGKSLQKDETGVWVGSQKVASLGIAVKKWVSYHGAAINLDHDPKAFQGLNPCGFSSSTMISIERLLGYPILRADFIERLKQQLQRSL